MESFEIIDFSFINDTQVESDIRKIVEQYWRFNDFDLAWAYFESKALVPRQDGTPKKFAFHGAGVCTIALLECAKDSPKLKGLVAILEKDPKKVAESSFPVPVLSTEVAPHLDVDCIIISSKPSETSMINNLLQLGVDRNKIIRFPEFDETFLAKSVETFTKVVNSSFSNNKTILFVSIYSQNVPLMELIARGMKAATQFQLFGVYLLKRPDKKIFDHTFFCNGSLRSFSEVLKQIRNVDLIYVQGHALWTFLSPMIRAIRTDIPLVHEVYDWMENVIEESKELPEKEQIYTKEESRLIKFSEKFIRNETEGFIYKDGGMPMEELLKTSSSSSLQFLPYFPQSWMTNVGEKPVEKPRLVFAGTVAATSSSKIYEDVKLLPLARDLTRQGFPFTIYNSTIYSAKQLEVHFDDYIEEAKNNPRFEFNSGIPLPDIIPHLSERYEYGLMLYYFNDDLMVGRNHIKASMASKIFTYLAAGLPILISEELENMVQLITKYRIGIVMSRNDIKDIHGALAKHSYEELRENIRTAQHELCLEKHIYKFINFLESVIDNRQEVVK